MPLENESSSTPCCKVIVIFSLLFSYVIGVYFHAATASLFNEYQPGIGTLKVCVQPGLMLFLPLLFAYFKKSKSAAEIAVWSSMFGLISCLVLLLLCSLHVQSGGVHWIALENRSLAGTVYRALFQPSFSNRSFGSTTGSAIFASLVCILSIRTFQRLEKRT
ncbi:hypothetical protein HNP33_002479 [Comamonas odontotermitis]|uniref:Uncharacterized protein n=1 Tax=Comamonas odontotermitis TaxID=379895 RepID=A0ABR6RGV7_9BURK|nr:hypothetical protein [Comamonas odontotermitis]MBB6578397.1 hypothetical protein [Comamonas odontotermitis]